MTEFKSIFVDVSDEITNNVTNHLIDNVYVHFSDIMTDVMNECNSKTEYTADEMIDIISTHIEYHVDKTMIEGNIDITKPLVIYKPLPTIVVIDEEIKRWDKKLVIETESHPTPTNPNRKTNVIKSRQLAKCLGLKSDRVRNVNKQKLLDQKVKGIAILCMVTEDKVRQVLRL